MNNNELTNKFKQLIQMNIKTRQEVWHKFSCKCAYCGENILYKEMQVDHIIPKSNFKTFILNKYKIPKVLSHLTIYDVNHLDNLNPSCRYCNKHKDTYDLEQFRKEIEAQIERLNKYNPNYRIAKRYNLIKEFPEKVMFYFEKNYYYEKK